MKGVPLEEVLKLIDKLPEGYGQVFRLSVFEGMSHIEIADMLGIEPHSTSSQLARAKKIMRIALNNANRPGADKILRTSHHHMPVTWSMALKHRLNNRFGLESGLSYSRLTSDFEMGVDGNTISEQQTIHYVGIPMKSI